jgi:hypothetical protein
MAEYMQQQQLMSTHLPTYAQPTPPRSGHAPHAAPARTWNSRYSQCAPLLPSPPSSSSSAPCSDAQPKWLRAWDTTDGVTTCGGNDVSRRKAPGLEQGQGA